MSAEVDPAAFAKVIADTPDKHLAEGMASENRALVPEGIFGAVPAGSTTIPTSARPAIPGDG